MTEDDMQPETVQGWSPFTIAALRTRGIKAARRIAEPLGIFVGIALPLGLLIGYWVTGTSVAAVSLSAISFAISGAAISFCADLLGAHRPASIPSSDFDAIAKEVFADDEFIPYANQKAALLERFKNEHGRLKMRADELRQEAYAVANNAKTVGKEMARLRSFFFSTRLPLLALTACVITATIAGPVANWAGFMLTMGERIAITIVAIAALAIQTVRLIHTVANCGSVGVPL